MSLSFLPNVAPVYPDFHLCDAVYGTDLLINDCRLAKDVLVATTHQANYYWGNPMASNSFPITASHGELMETVGDLFVISHSSLGGCHIAVEAAGGIHSQMPVPISPPMLSILVSWVIRQCAVGRNGLGGMVTHGLAPIIAHYQSIPASDDILVAGRK